MFVRRLKALVVSGFPCPNRVCTAVVAIFGATAAMAQTKLHAWRCWPSFRLSGVRTIFFWPLVILNQGEVHTLQTGLNAFSGELGVQ